MMRIITGSARGVRLDTLEGEMTRPTTERAKEAVFSILRARTDLSGARVLDLFAGTGQLGIECLSRGAASAAFVDRRPDAIALIRENLKLCGLTDRARVTAGDSLEFLKSAREKYDLIFLDPPYASGLLEEALKLIAKRDLLRPHGVVTAECPAEHVLPELPTPYRMGRRYRYGKISLGVYRREEDAL